MPDATPRSFGFGELLDGAFTLYRRNFVAFFGAAFIPQIPVVIFWLTAPLWMEPGPIDGVPESTLGGILLFPYSIFATLLTLGALTRATGEAYAGETPAAGESLRRGLVRLIPLAVAGLVAGLAVAIGLMFFIIPGLIFAAMFFGIAPAVVLEDRAPGEALGRSRALSKGGRARILGVLIVAQLITTVPIVALSAVAGIGGFAGMGAADLQAYEGLMGLAQAASPVVGALTFPFFVAVTVLLYYDRRARTEAPDLEGAMDQLQPEA